MKKRRVIVVLAILACALAAAAGWFYQQPGVPSLPSGGWQGELYGGRTSVSVW